MVPVPIRSPWGDSWGLSGFEPTSTQLVWDKGDSSLQSQSSGGHGEVMQTILRQNCALPLVQAELGERVAGFPFPTHVKGLACVCRYLHELGAAPAAPTTSCRVKAKRRHRAGGGGHDAVNPHGGGCSASHSGIRVPDRGYGEAGEEGPEGPGMGTACEARRAVRRHAELCAGLSRSG